MTIAHDLAKPSQAKPSAVTPAEASPTQVKPSPKAAVERDRLRMMMLIRHFEQRTYQEYTRPGQKIGGFCHLYSGQEAIAVGIAAIFDKSRDYLVNGYRCHGHSLALGMSPRAAMAELFGKATGCSKGKGGSMHLFDAAAGNLGGHGIVGGQIPLGVGMAFSQWYRKTGGVTFTLFGDGAVNQGTFNEGMNLAGLYKLPCIFVVENNGLAMGTQVERSSAEHDLAKRGSGYGMPCSNLDGNDLDLVIAEFSKAMERGRAGQGPSYIVANTYRFRGHSMSDPMKYRSKEEAERAARRDPITLYQQRLIQRGLMTEEQVRQLDEQTTEEINQATAQADADPHPAPDDRFTDVLAEQYPFLP
jgi:pyruvate dehydrogenase E1 component alpha subunit